MNKEKILLLLDIDDTICNASEAYEKALNKCYLFLKKKYPLITKKLFYEKYRIAREQIHLELEGTASMHNRLLYFQRMFELLGLSLNPFLLDEITELYWKEVYKNLKLFPNVRSTLKLLKENNIKIGIISDLISEVQIKKLKKLKISKYVDFIVTSEEAGKEKPHPSIFLLALKKANKFPKETVVVGDSVRRDIIGAKNLGMTSVLFSKKKEKESKADYVIGDFSKVLNLFDIKSRRFTNKKMVVFNFMGAIFKESHVIKNGLYKFLVKKGKKIKYDDLKKLYLEYSLGKISEKEFNKVVKKELEEEFLKSISINKDSLKTIKNLKKKGIMIGVLSNLPSKWGYFLINENGLENLFDIIVLSGEHKSRKPSEKLYMTLLEKINVKPQNCYLVDDKIENLKEARFLLMKTIWLKKEKQEITFIPDFMIKKIKEVEKIFQKG